MVFLSSRSALQFSCFRSFHFRHFGISKLRVFVPQDFGFQGFGVSILENSRLTLLSNPRLLKFCFTLFFGSTAQLSPFTKVVHGTFRRILVMFGDIIRVPPLSLLFSTLLHVVHLHVFTSIPRKIQRSDLSHIGRSLKTRRFPEGILSIHRDLATC
jgi:hypothetical protein